MAHSQHNHDIALNQLCRICGGVTLTQKQKKASKKPYLINDALFKSIKYVCGIGVSKETFHSKYVCQNCYKTIQNSRQGESDISKQRLKCFLNDSSDLWQPYDHNIDVDNCGVCARHEQNKQGAHAGKSNQSKPAFPNQGPIPDVALDISSSNNDTSADTLIAASSKTQQFSKLLSLEFKHHR